MSDNVAILEGFTQEVVASCSATDLYLLIKPGTDLDSTFRAWDTDEQEFITVNGWLFTFEFAKPETKTIVRCPRCGEPIWDVAKNSKLNKCWNCMLAFDSMEDDDNE